MVSAYENIPRLKAERMLVAAQCAIVPHMSSGDARMWWDKLRRQAAGDDLQYAEPHLMFDGRRVSIAALKRLVSAELGPGYSE